MKQGSSLLKAAIEKIVAAITPKKGHAIETPGVLQHQKEVPEQYGVVLCEVLVANVHSVPRTRERHIKRDIMLYGHNNQCVR